MKTAQKVIDQAKAWLGYNEYDGSHKRIIDVYNGHKPLARGYKVSYMDAWCATFVSAVAIKLGYTDIIPTECSCPRMIDLFKEKGCWMENEKRTPQEGEIIFYDWEDSGVGDNMGSSDHVGIIEKVSGGVITVIEGNYSNSVKRRTIAVNGRYIRGYGIPAYDGIEAPKQPSNASGGASAKPITAKIEVDGIWGQETTKKAQQVFHTPVDGIISNQLAAYKPRFPGILESTIEWEYHKKGGSALIKAMQVRVGVEDDGYLGQDTARAWQRFLDTPVDGIFDKPSTFIKAFQNWLNAQ